MGKFQNIDPKSVTVFDVLRHHLALNRNSKYRNHNLDKMFQCLILCVMIIDIINYMICLLRWNGLKGNLNNGLVMQSLVSCWSQQKLKTLIFMTIMLNFGPCYNNWNRILGWALIALFQKGPFCTWLCNFVFGPNYGPQNIDPKSVTLFDTLRHFRHILYKSITKNVTVIVTYTTIPLFWWFIVLYMQY